MVVEAVGPLDVANLTPMVTEARAAAAGRGCNILYDFRETTLGDIQTGDLFWFPRRIPALAKAEARRVRIALLYPANHVAFARFWETTFQNAGLRARAFETEGEAHAWLGEDDA